MPLVVGVPFVAILGAALLLALLAWWFVVARPWIEEAGDITFIGRYIQKAGDAVERFIIGLWTKYVAEPAKALAGWLHGVATQLVDLPEQVVELAATVKRALAHLRQSVVPALIDTAVRPLERSVGALDRLLDRTRTELGALERGLDARIDTLRDVTIPNLRRDARAWVDQLERWGEGIEGRLRQLTDQLWERAIGPLTDVIGNQLPLLRGRVGELERGLEDVAPYVLGLAAAVPLAQAIEGTRAAARAKPKLDRMCVLDLDEVEDWVGFAFAALSMGELVELVRAGQELAEEHAGLVAGLIDGN